MAESLERLRAALADHYAIERAIGQGGMATVYLAQDVKHERPVAVKVLHPELAAVLGAERFLREIKLTGRLNHPHILPLLDSGEADGFLFYVMPYIEGESLRDRLDREKQLPIDDALQISREVADALSYAHSHDIVHRDIKPENILLSAGHAVVADFGIARAITAAGGEKLTDTGLAIGTPMYMSPEQAAGEKEIDGRSDQYSLACVLYETLAGEPPFTGPTAQAVIAKRFTGPVPQLTQARASVPSPVAQAVTRALAPVPADRFATAGQFAAALGSGASKPSGGHAAPKSIAVLPFANVSADPENEYFTDGITEDVINALSKIGSLRVASRTSAFVFKGAAHDIREIGRRLSVATVLEGSVRRAANRLRITAQLIDVATGYHLWSEQYDREMHDVFAMQDEISRAIVGTLKVRLAVPDAERLVRPQTDSLEAYDLYLKGRYHWNRRGAGLHAARECFIKAIETDPEYAAAHSALADTYALLGWYRYQPPAEALPPAKRAALKAVELDESLAEAHASVAFVLMMWDWDWEGAERAFLRALELNPGYATAHHWYAEYLMARGRLDEAIAQSRRALELDPLGLIIHAVLGMSYYFARRYEEAVATCAKTLEIESTFAPACIWIGLACLKLGRYDEAVAAFQREVDLAPERPTTSAYLAAAYAFGGRRAEARRVLANLGTRAPAYVSAYDFALVHLALGENDEAFRWFERAYEERASLLPWLGVDPYFDSVRGDPRFQRLLARLGLAAA